MRIYGGASGVWVDKVRTGPISEDGSGVAVGLLHTGTSYSDDLSALGIIYHYPQTNRPTARDQAEIDATKNAARQGIPVFVIAYPSPNAATRDVFLAWVEGWDDVSKTFYIGFGESPPEQLIEDPLDSEPFEPIEKRNRKMGQVPQRPDQGRFRFRVLRRYGPKCMVCDVRVDQLLEAAHVVPDNRDGTYDPRNGLVFCRNHHRSFDLDLFAIGGIDYSIEFPDEGIDSRMLQITAQKLEPMKNKFPHNDALRTRYAGSSVNSKE